MYKETVKQESHHLWLHLKKNLDDQNVEADLTFDQSLTPHWENGLKHSILPKRK